MPSTRNCRSEGFVHEVLSSFTAEAVSIAPQDITSPEPGLYVDDFCSVREPVQRPAYWTTTIIEYANCHALRHVVKRPGAYTSSLSGFPGSAQRPFTQEVCAHASRIIMLPCARVDKMGSIHNSRGN